MNYFSYYSNLVSDYLVANLAFTYNKHNVVCAKMSCVLLAFGQQHLRQAEMCWHIRASKQRPSRRSAGILPRCIAPFLFIYYGQASIRIDLILAHFRLRLCHDTRLQKHLRSSVWQNNSPELHRNPAFLKYQRYWLPRLLRPERYSRAA